MKDPLDRTKVVLRHLPPSISQAVLMEQVDARFAGRYRWTAFRPGKTSHKNMCYARAYIDFKRPEDVLEFAEFFDGHVFVNEKGSQFKTIVEYAPSQRVPKSWLKKDGREGTVHKDPEYLEFLEMLAKPVENLPSAEIQLERREAERANAPKETVVVTPLMEFVRQKRAAKNGSQRTPSGKLSRRTNASFVASVSHKRGSEKQKVSASMYVLRDNTKVSAGKTSYTIVSRKDEQKASDDSGTVSLYGSEVLEDEGGASGHTETGKKKVLLLKPKEREVTSTSPEKKSPGSSSFKQNHRRDISGKIIRSILSNKEARQNQPQSASIQGEQQLQAIQIEKDKRPPRPVRTILKDFAHASSASPSEADNRTLVEKITGSDSHGVSPASDKPDRRTRNKDRPDRGVWAPLRRSDALQSADDPSSLPGRSSAEAVDSTQVAKPMVSNKRGDDGVETRDGIGDNQSGITVKSRSQGTSNHHGRSGRGVSLSPDLPLNHGEPKADTASTGRGGEAKFQGSGRSSIASAENGSHRYGRRVPATGSREVDNLSSIVDGKTSKKGSPGYGAHEKQIWIQKSGSGS